MVVICGMLKNFLSSDGIITTLLSYLGFPQKNLLMVPAYYRAIHVASGIWQTVGWNSIIYLSALAGIDQEQYEAADLDGAGRLQKMCYITLPGILPTITVMFIIRLGQVMSVGYAVKYGEPGDGGCDLKLCLPHGYRFKLSAVQLFGGGWIVYLGDQSHTGDAGK